MIPDTLLIEMVRAFPAVAVLVYVTWRQERLLNCVLAACVRHLEQEAKNEASDPR